MAWLITLAVIGVVAFPAFLDEQGDSFPFSSYPMFSRPLSRVETLPTAVVAAPGSAPRVLPPEAFGTDNVMQTVTILWRAVQAGPDAALALCRRLALDPRAAGGTDLRAVGEVRIVLGTFDVIDYFDASASPLREQIIARCPVAKSGGNTQ